MKLNLSKMVHSAKRTLAKHSPEILTGIGIAGMITAVVTAVKATPKAVKLIDDEIKNRTESNTPDEEGNIDGLVKTENESYKLPVKDTVKTAWKCYIPTAVTIAASTACVVGGSSVNLRRNAALATAYSLSETALKEFKEKTAEIVGEDKEREIKDAVAKGKIEKNPPRTSEVVFTGTGKVLCYDSITGRYFKSDKETIRKAVNDLNMRLRDEMYVSLNDFYYEIGLKETKFGDLLGWNMDRGYIDVEYSSQLDDSGTPCLVIDYSVAPPEYHYQY